MADAPIWTILPFLGLVFLASLTGGVFRPGQWYESLDKPSWTPPDWLFPVAWGLLYVLMAYAAWRVWDIAGLGLPIYVWGVQLVLNAGWSAVFFGMKSPALALVDLIMLWLGVAATIWLFALVEPLSAWLLAPYIVWVTLAGVLNAEIVRRRASAA
ncbi:MAG: TspO/MBR family protein [Oceanicaulis sp.]